MGKKTKGLVNCEWMITALVIGFMAGGVLNAKEAVGEAKDADSEYLDAPWEDNKIEGDPFAVVRVGEVCPSWILKKSRPIDAYGESRRGVHRRCFGRISGFGDFCRFALDVSTNDSKVVAMDLYSPSPLINGAKPDKWLTNCVQVCDRHYDGIEWGMLRDRVTGHKDALCARRKGDRGFGGLFIMVKSDAREMIEPHGLVEEYDRPWLAILHVEIPKVYLRDFGESSPLFAERYLYRTVPVTSFER